MNETLLPLSMQSQIWEARLQSVDGRISDTANTPFVLGALTIMIVLVGLRVVSLDCCSKIKSCISRTKRRTLGCSRIVNLQG